MPRNGSGVYSLPPGSTFTPNTLIQSSIFNGINNDLATDLNTPRPIVAGGTGASSAAAARDALGLTIGTNVLGITYAPPGLLSGLVLSNDAGDPVNDIGVAAGFAASDASTATLISLPAGIVKRLDAAWAVGSGNGGLDTGSVGNNKYYVWLIQRSDTSVVDALFSLSSTAPTMPTNYDRKALIGSFGRVGGINNGTRSFSQKEPTPWVGYTPSFGGLTGSSLQMFSRRVGDTLEVDGLFSVTGLVAATQMFMTLGFNGVDGRVTIDGGKLTSSRHVGTAVRDVAVAGSFYLIGSTNTNILRFSFVSASTGGLTLQNSDAITANGQIWSVQARVPVFGW